ncbi:hypothetical protein FRC14_005272 [Serendipita sp. 396]|nr:hypothetical protein FRC14_005272 [Serendipita sp. 396]
MATTTKEQKDPRTAHDLVSLITSSSPLGSTSTKPITIYPNDDTLLSLLHARFRHDLPFTRLGSSSLVAVNPNKLIVADNETSMREIAEKAWDASGRWRKDGGLQAHAFEFATRIYLANRRFNEPQLVIPRGITASGKSHALDLLTRQILHLSSSPAFTLLSSTGARKAQKIASQISAFNTLLNSFGRAKTQASPDASKYSSYTELHFSSSAEATKGAGAIVGAKVLTWGLDKSRLARLRQDERTFHIFYQLLSGASPSLYESMSLEDASEYALLASSGCYRLPSGPFSDDAAQFGVVQDAMTALGFKDRHKEGVWRVLSALLTLGNIEFDEPLSKRDLNAGYLGGANGLGGNAVEGQEEVRILNPGMLDRAARLLGVGSEDLTNLLTVKSSYVRKEVFSTYLELGGARRQRDALAGGLYTLLFSYIVETANHKLNPAPSSSDSPESTVPIIFLDSPGYFTRASQGTGALVSSASGGNGFTEFSTNFQDEIIQSYVLRHDFDDNLSPSYAIVNDGIHLPSMTIMDNSTVIELLRGGLVTADEKSIMGKRVAGVLGVMNKAATSIRKGGYVSGEEMVQELVGSFSTNPSFIQPISDPFASTTSFAPNQAAAGLRRFANFGINHYAGPVTYGVQDWVEFDADAWDAGFVRVLRGSGDGFIKRLVSGPGIASESHIKDPNIVVRAQVSSRPIRNPSLFGPANEDDDERAYGLDPTKAYPLTTQFNSVLSSLLSQLERVEARLWTIQCIRPNDSGLSNSFDKKRVRAQIRSQGIVDLVGRKQHEWVEDYSYSDFLAMSGMGSGIAGGAEDGIRAFASGERWTEGVDYTFGKTKVWLSWDAWRDFDDRQRPTENGMRAVSPSRGHGDEDEAHSAEGGEQSEHHGWGGRNAGVAGRRSIGSMAFGASQEDLLYSRGGLASADPTGTFPADPPGSQPGWNGSAEWEKGSAEGYAPPALTKGGQNAIEMSKSGGKNGYANLAGGEADASTAPVPEKGGKGKALAKPIEVIPTTRARRCAIGIYRKEVYDLSDYVYTLNQNNGGGGYDYINGDVVDVFRQQTGQDITKALDSVLEGLTERQVTANMACLKNRFYYGKTDFRETPRCTIQGYLLVAFSVIIAATILVKFLAALQLTSKRSPELLDKFIICQVPCYTEGEESLRRTIDSLAALKYDDKRKLLFIICDGNIVGSGNDRPTPRIVLDILGVDPSLDPEPLMFRSIGEGSKQLNYGKIYSGLYEFEGHVVPYMVVVKVGKPSERQRPGNRGKRDSQILLLHYLNRVHFDAPMSPLELEMYHQMHNIIGIDPAFYEYIFMVDADTTVTPDSLNRLVAVTSDDSRVIAVCGETKLDNEDGSWWTMIQVYEYYISHHLAKAFESLFGSVTCLPGCFSMYRIRTADKGRPLIISTRIIEEYSECNVDTLHKKNLLQLGEDRYLTTIMMKHFPLFKMKFTPDAIAHTVAPDRWSVLLSQRRRWINSTIHNLLELVGLGELCGFCCFSMRFIVFVDLLGTLILPATAVYLVYLIVVVATHASPLPVVSLAMIGAVYGLQAVIFLLKREFMLIGWMIIYILAYPVYSFFLPIYSFWSMDDFSWGNTRIVVGEGRDRKVIIQDDEGFDENAIPLKKFSDYEAEALDQGEHHSVSGDSRPESRARSAVPPFRPQSRQGSQAGSGYPSPAGDYYRDTNITYNNSSNPNLRLPPVGPLASLHASTHGGSQPELPHLPSMPFAGPGSEYGHSRMGSMAGMSMGPMGMPGATGFDMMGGPGEFGSFGYAGSGYGGSAYGGTGAPGAPRNSVMTNLNMFGGSGGGAMGSAPPSSFPSMGTSGFGQQQRPMSTFSMATSINPLMNSAPSLNPNPSDEELLSVLRLYLSTQDLMTVTKKTAREAVMARFPKADLSSKKDFLNQSIERILSET